MKGLCLVITMLLKGGRLKVKRDFFIVLSDETHIIFRIFIFSHGDA